MQGGRVEVDWSHERDQDCVEGGEVADRSITVPSESAENATYQVGGQLTLGAIYPSLGLRGVVHLRRLVSRTRARRGCPPSARAPTEVERWICVPDTRLSATGNARLACLDDEVVAARAVVEVDDAWNAERCALSSRPIDAVRRVGSDDADDRQDPG